MLCEQSEMNNKNNCNAGPLLRKTTMEQLYRCGNSISRLPQKLCKKKLVQEVSSWQKEKKCPPAMRPELRAGIHINDMRSNKKKK